PPASRAWAPSVPAASGDPVVVRSLPEWTTCEPEAVAASWPAETPLLMLHSGRHHAGRARWSILGMPDAWVIAPTPPHQPANPVTVLDEALAGTRLDAGARSTAHDSLPFVGGWIGVLGYELGRVMEPSASRGPDPRQRTDGTAWPLIEFARCGGALLFDAADQTWRIV